MSPLSNYSRNKATRERSVQRRQGHGLAGHITRKGSLNVFAKISETVIRKRQEEVRASNGLSVRHSTSSSTRTDSEKQHCQVQHMQNKAKTTLTTKTMERTRGKGENNGSTDRTGLNPRPSRVVSADSSSECTERATSRPLSGEAQLFSGQFRWWD